MPSKQIDPDWASGEGWWFKPHDFIWMDDSHCARFVADEGDRWLIAIDGHTQSTSAPVANCLWELDDRSLDAFKPTGLTSASRDKLKENLRLLSPPDALDSLSREVLAQVAGTTSDIGSRTGKEIRYALRHKGNNAVNRRLKLLYPRYLARREGPHDDYYEFELAGFEKSLLMPKAVQGINAFLEAQHLAYHSDQKVDHLDWKDVKAAGLLADSDEQLTRQVVRAAGLGSWSGIGWTLDPLKTERLWRASNYQQLKSYLRKGTHSVPAPSAPMLPSHLLVIARFDDTPAPRKATPRVQTYLEGCPRVFISYSHDSSEHVASVLKFAQALRSDGVDVQLDQYLYAGPDVGWATWMDKEVASADFVLVICNAATQLPMTFSRT